MKIIVIALALTFVCGCKSASSYKSDFVSVEDTRTYVSTRNAGSCIFADAKSLESGEAIAVALATTIIKEGVSMVGRALTEAGASKTATSVPAFGNFTSGVGEPPVCVQIVRGKFYPKAPPTAQAGIPEWALKSGLSVAQWERMQSKGIYLSEAPALFFEGQIAKSKNPNIFTLAPIYLSFRESIDGDGLSFKSYRHISVALDFFSPEASSDKPLGSTILSLGRVDRGRILCFGKEAQCQYSHKFEDPFVKSTKYFWLQLPEGAESPMYIQSVFTETRDANEFVGFLGRVMTPNEKIIADNLNNEVEMMISRTKQEEAKATLMTLKESNRTAYDDAIKDAIPIFEACKEADVSDQQNYYIKVMDAANAQRKINSAAAAADVALPFVDGLFINRPSTDSMNARRCKTSLDKIYKGV